MKRSVCASATVLALGIALASLGGCAGTKADPTPPKPAPTDPATADHLAALHAAALAGRQLERLPSGASRARRALKRL